MNSRATVWESMMIHYFGMMLAEGAKVFTLDLFGYFVTAGLFGLLVFKIQPVRLMARKIQNTRTATTKDIKREIKASVRTGLIFAVVGMLGYNLHHLGLINVYTDISTYGWAYFALSFPLVIIAHDAWFYWTHRAMHHKKLFKYTHVTHHQSRIPTPFTAFSFDPIEAASHALFTTVFVLLVPVHPLVMAGHFIFMIIRNVMGHAGHELMPRWWLNSRWTRWINTTTHHDLHHQRGGYNLGLYFTWWDKLMGTEHPDYVKTFNEVWARSDAIDEGADIQPASHLTTRLIAGVLGLFIGVGMLLATSMGRAAESDANGFAGRWVSAKRDIVLDIGPCLENQAKWCGQIVWVPENKDGSLRLDQKNKDKTLQSRPLVGVMMGWGFQEVAPGHYDGGKIYSPDDGNVYKSKVRVITDNAVELDGCVFIFCRTEHLDRYQPGMKLYDPVQDALVNVALPIGQRYAQED